MERKLFVLDGDGNLRWDEPHDARTELTTEEARVIALANAASGLRYIGDALYEVVNAIKELRRQD